MEITHEKACLCALNRIFGFEPKIASALISHLGSAAEVFSLKPDDLDMLLGPYSKHKGSISASAVEKEARALDALAAQGITFIGRNEPGYPPLLLECEDAPTGLYLRSCCAPEDLWQRRRFISVVGTRDLSPYGKEWCERIVRSLAEVPAQDRPTIVSGLALGTDACAHRSALTYGLPTIGVMATGPEAIYPHRHQGLADRILQSPGSALITDYPPGTAPLAIHFLRRNRIIAGMSEATVLIESKIKGGGMMTARLADSYNRTVLALPGRVDDLRSQGCNYLIRNRTAVPITSISELLKEFGMSSRKDSGKVSDAELLEHLYKGAVSDDRIARMSAILLAIRRERGITVEEIAGTLGLEYSLISQLVGMLETDGVITRDILQRCFINFRKEG